MSKFRHRGRGTHGSSDILGHFRHHRRRRRLRRLFLGRQQAAGPDLPVARGQRRVRRSTICAGKGMIRPWLFVGPALIILDRLPGLPGRRDAPAVLPRPRRHQFRRPRQLPVGLRRPRVPQVDPQQHAVAGRRAGRLHVPRAGHRRAHRPHLVGQHRQEPDLPADGDLLRRRQRDLEVHLRISRRRPDADRHAQRHRPGSRRPAAGLDHRCRSGTISS